MEILVHHVNEFLVYWTLNANYKYTCNYTLGNAATSIISETKKPVEGYKKDRNPY